jgi:phosphatidate cytidylyltransferase
MVEFKSIKTRLLTSIILLPVAILLIIIGGVAYDLALIIVGGLLYKEAFDLLANKKTLLKKWFPYLVAYISVPLVSLIAIRNLKDGIDITLFLFFLVWVTDIAAFFGGKNIGGPKLLPKVSPNKTISGSATAIFAVIALAIMTFFFTDNISFFNLIASSIFLCIISQIGDLFESYLKRQLNAKDSGDIIPGHGGLFDRIDGLLFAAPFAYLIFGLINHGNL